MYLVQIQRGRDLDTYLTPFPEYEPFNEGIVMTSSGGSENGNDSSLRHLLKNCKICLSASFLAFDKKTKMFCKYYFFMEKSIVTNFQTYGEHLPLCLLLVMVITIR